MSSVRDEVREQILETVRRFVSREVLPVVTELESTDTYPQALFDQMADLGLFALALPEQYGGLDAGYETISLVLQELSHRHTETHRVASPHPDVPRGPARPSWLR